MRYTDGRLAFSATDLNRHLSCAHLTSLRRGVALGEIEQPPPYDDPRAEVLKQRGIEHERRLLERFAAEGRTVETIIPGNTPVWQRDPEAAAARTSEAMRRGVDIVYQGRLQDDDGRWSGYPDFLVRVDAPSALGGWSYEVLDTKLARIAKGEALLQLLLYSDLLAQVQGTRPGAGAHPGPGAAGRPTHSRVDHAGRGGQGTRRAAGTLAGRPVLRSRRRRLRHGRRARVPLRRRGSARRIRRPLGAGPTRREAGLRAFHRPRRGALAGASGLPHLHYGACETTAVKRLMSRYATREEEVDRLLRGRVFVDLHRVVRQGLRASVEGYSIKRLEPFYGFVRRVDLTAATRALVRFEAALESGEADGTPDELRAEIEGYNRDDCLSTLRLTRTPRGRKPTASRRWSASCSTPARPG